jgi:hypothetical protein
MDDSISSACTIESAVQTNTGGGGEGRGGRGRRGEGIAVVENEKRVGAGVNEIMCVQERQRE